MRVLNPIHPIACLVLAAGLVLGACGQDKICAEGTREVGGACVPDIEGCGPGTVVQGGECVPACPQDEYWAGAACAPVPACAPGTRFDPVAADCVPACAPNERFDGQDCVPVCAPGTSLDPQTGQCRPGPDACAPGTSWVDGQCLPDLECGPGTHLEGNTCVPDRLPDPDVSESGDPDLPATFGLPAAGEQVSLGGTVDTPRDPDGDGYPEANWDVFAVTAPTGTWLRIQATSEGACLPAFLIMSTDSDDQGRPLFSRYGINPTGLAAEREVYLPRPGSYLILVSDYHNLMIDVFGYGFIPVGGDDFSYYVTVENLGVPPPDGGGALPLVDSGELTDGRLRFFHLPGLLARDVLSARSPTQPLPGVPSNLLPVLLLFGPDGELLTEAVGGWNADASLTKVLPADGGYLLVQDFLIATGPALDYRVEAALEPVLDCSAQACTPRPLAEGEHVLWSYDLAAGDFFLFKATVPFDATENLGVAFYDSDWQLIGDASAGPSWIRWDHLYAEQDTWIYLWIDGWFGGAVPAWTFESVQTAVPPLLPGQPGLALPVHAMPADTIGDCGLARFDALAGEVVVVSDFVPYDPALSWLTPAHEFADPQLKYLGPALDTTDPSLMPMDPPLVWIPADGTYLHRALDADPAATIAGGSYDLTLGKISPIDLGEPLAGSPAVRTDQQLDPNTGLALFVFQATRNQSYDIAITPAGGASLQPELRLLAFGYHYLTNWYSRADQSELGMLARYTAAAGGSPASGNLVAPYDGPLVIAVLSVSGNPADLFEIQVAVGN